MSPEETAPQRLPLVPVVFFVLILCGLGTWQLQRLEWKKQILADIETAQQAEPLDLNEQFMRNITMPDYQRLKVTGHFDHAHEFYVPSRVHDGKVGFHIVTPFITPMGQTYLVNRGWVPLEQKLPATRSAGQVEGEVTLQGLARIPQSPSRWQPPNDVAHNLWYGMDLPLMYISSDIKTGPPLFYIDADASPNPGGLPIGGITRLNISNNHLQYAITWYSLAAIIAFIFAANRLRPLLKKE